MKFLKRAAAVGAASLVAGALVTVPANAAATGLKYDCTDPVGTVHEFLVDVDTDAPDSIEAGKSFTPAITATVHVTDSLRDLLVGIGAVSVEGAEANGISSSLTYSVDGVETTAAVTIPVTSVAAGVPLAVPANATGEAVTPAAAGTLNIAAGNFTAVLAGKDATGGPSFLSPYTIPCVLQEGQEALVDSVTVTEAATKAATKTNVKAKYAKKKKQVKANIAVKAGKKAAKGKVRVVLKKGKKTVAKRTVKLNKMGKKVVKFKKIRAKGKYRVIANYKGNKKFEKSRGVAKVRVR